MTVVRTLARWPVLVLRMLRYRVAMMLWLFLLLGAAAHGGIAEAGPKLAWAALALGASYVAATSVNDLADRAIDTINHPGDPARPLVTGELSPAGAVAIHVVASIVAVAAAAWVGEGAVGLVLGSLVVGQIYSLPPLQVSRRTWLAPLLLAFAYVLVPYGLGLSAIGAAPSGRDAVLAAALVTLFLARIVLKDFRDRAGDAAHGRPTLLLRFGRGVTCAVSLGALVMGDALLLTALRPPLWVAAVLQAAFLAVVSRLAALARASDGREEQLAIGLGARMGNAALIAVLAWLLMEAERAPVAATAAVVAAVSVAAWSGYVALLREPGRAVLAYKG